MSTERVTFLRLHDHTGWAVLFDGAEIGRVHKVRTSRSSRPRAYYVWQYEGDPCCDSFESRTLCVAALIADRVRT